jgi:SAM-dependent methyltransferase
MDAYREETYGERIADVYDAMYGGVDEAAVEVLCELAAGGRALELGIGTGRVALPLRASGIPVHGIDASEAMVAKLRAKPGGETIPVTRGDFAEVAVEGEFDLVYVLFNTFFSLLTQEAQVRCLRNVARHLAPKGRFVIEAFVPDLTRFTGRQAVRAARIAEDEVQLDVSQHDPITQQITSQHLLLSEQGTRLYPVRLRYVWPAELDLMAQLAGLTLGHRWSNWQKRAFTSSSTMHISVYERAEATVASEG